MQPIAWSAEFPNDNPLLHEGAVWICTTVRGAPRAILRARASVPPPADTAEPEPLAPPEPAVVTEPEPVVLAEPEPAVVTEPEPVVVTEPEPVVEVVAAEAGPEPLVVAAPQPAVEAPEPEPVITPEPDPFQELVEAISEVVLEGGATRAAASVPALLDGQPLGAESFPGEALELLVARGVVERGPSGVELAAAFVATSAAWRRVLRGELADLTDCGTATLDQWASELAAALIGAPPTRCDDLRRQLRRRGVAAFGMLAKAA